MSKVTTNIKKSIAGLCAVAVMVMGFAFAFAPTASAACAAGTYTLANGAGCAQTTDANGAPAGPSKLFGTGGIFTTIINTALFVIGAISVLMLIYGGIRYTISGGDSGAVTNAKNTILYAIVGIIVSVLAYAIVNFVINALVTT